MALIEKLTAIADAIRSKTGKTNKITLDQMPGEIEGIEVYEGGDNTEFIKMLDRSGDTITIPDGCTAIGDYAFYSHSTLTSVQIPDTVTNIGNSSFYQCSKLAEINIPVNLNILGTRAFYNCRGLTSVTFRNTPTSIANNSFGACTNLKTINVPWEYGAVENAPWGATSATINYNYTG